MPFDQYHEPPEELPEETRSFARMIIGLIEEAEAISWYEQRIAVEPDETARRIMQNAQNEETKHFVMDLAWLMQRKPIWRKLAEQVLFKDGDILELAEEAEESIIH